jgi:2-(1,2-epoxy-1,2-dihydrophenyl)acetyl-CoA isomerase
MTEIESGSSNGIACELRAGVAIIALDRPELLNRLDGAMREALLDALESAARSAEVRCVLITGRGRAFSAGADIENMLELHRRGAHDEIRRRVELGASIVRRIRSMAKPVVAALNGIAAGAGANLALACDVRLGSERAGFSESFVQIGLVPDWGGLYFLVRLVGPARAADLMLTGARIDAARSLSLGLLEHVYPEDRFEQEALAYATRLAAGPARALAKIKAGIELAAGGTLEAVLAFEREVQPALFAEDDCLEGLRAFLEKRAPRFSGGAH